MSSKEQILTNTINGVCDINFPEFHGEDTIKRREFFETMKEKFPSQASNLVKNSQNINNSLQIVDDESWLVHLSTPEGSLKSLIRFLTKDCDLNHTNLEFFEDCFSDTLTFDSMKNSIWMKRRTKFTNQGQTEQLLGSFVDTESKPGFKLSIPITLTKEFFDQFETFAKIPFIRITYSPKINDSTISVCLDCSCMSDGKWYLFIQIKGKNGDYLGSLSWIQKLKEKFCKDEDALSKVIMYLLILNNKDTKIEDFSKPIQETLNILKIHPKFNKKQIHETEFFNFCEILFNSKNKLDSLDSFFKFCEIFFLKDCKFKIKSESEYISPKDWETLKNYLQNPKNFNWGPAKIPYFPENKAKDESFKFSNTFGKKKAEITVIGLDMTTLPEDAGLGTKIFDYNLEIGVSFLLLNALVDGDACFFIHKLLADGKIEFESKKYNDSNYWLKLSFFRGSFHAVNECSE